MEIFSASHGVKNFHAVIDNFSAASQATPPAWHFHGQARMRIIQNNTLVNLSEYIKTDRRSSWH